MKTDSSSESIRNLVELMRHLLKAGPASPEGQSRKIGHGTRRRGFQQLRRQFRNKGTNVGIKYAQRRIDYVFTAKGIINAVHKYHCFLSAPHS